MQQERRKRKSQEEEEGDIEMSNLEFARELGLHINPMGGEDAVGN